MPAPVIERASGATPPRRRWVAGAPSWCKGSPILLRRPRRRPAPSPRSRRPTSRRCAATAHPKPGSSWRPSSADSTTRLVDGETRSLAEAVLQLLVRDLEVQVRQTLAEALAASPRLPAEVVRRLAHDDIAVAAPVLERSPVLSDEELGEIVRSHAMQYALAVAGREHLPEFLSDILAETGDVKVVARLVGNAGAQISQGTLQRVAPDYQEDPGVQDNLIRRPALPYERSGFGTPHYVAVRMTLDLAERGLRGQAGDGGYADATMRYVQQRYERIRRDEALVGQLAGALSNRLRPAAPVARKPAGGIFRSCRPAADGARSCVPVIHIAVDRLTYYGSPALRDSLMTWRPIF